MNILYLIPARAGSKGLPNKNIKLLGNKPLIQYTIDFALNNLKSGDELCISTDDENVIQIAKNSGIHVPFLRPSELASNTASTYDVIMHAINFFKNKNRLFDLVLLLQPTSPFRTQTDFNNLIEAYNNELEMVVSVKKAKENPYFTLYEENEFGFLDKSKKGNFQRRQDCPDVYAFNGSMYLIKIMPLMEKKIYEFTKIKKIVMPEERSVDIDTMADWILAEFYLENQ
jgi:CMP-N,N'-diacetyllegionaminic acid synthase